MAGLQRSSVSFRRQGSSGLVWDDKVLSGELNQLANLQKEEKNNKRKQSRTEVAAAAKTSSRTAELAVERSRSNGGRGSRTGRVSPEIEPPSPRVSACGFCSAFGKNKRTRPRPPKSGKRVV